MYIFAGERFGIGTILRFRRTLHQVVNFWRQKRVQGFCFDVLNVIGKSEDLVDNSSSSSQERIPLYRYAHCACAGFGVEPSYFWAGSRNRHSWEMSSTTIENGISYTNPKIKNSL